MSARIKISSGILKNRVLKSIPSVKGHSEYTPSIIKEAIFSICNSISNIEDYVFVDLFAGSGAVIWEAYSRGFKNIIFTEKDTKRFNYIKETKEQFQISDINLELHNKDFEYLLKHLDMNKKIILFADPPYGQKRKNIDVLELIVNKYLKDKLSPDSIIFFQLPHLRLRKNPPAFSKSDDWEIRNYGSNSLLIFYA